MGYVRIFARAVSNPGQAGRWPAGEGGGGGADSAIPTPLEVTRRGSVPPRAAALTLSGGRGVEGTSVAIEADAGTPPAPAAPMPHSDVRGKATGFTCRRGKA